MKKQELLFIKDVVIFTITAFGGPQAHISILLREFVEKKKYISEIELLELNTLSQLLPGPSSTQTLIGIAWKVGGTKLAIITFLIWILPSSIIMCLAAISYKTFADHNKFTHIVRFVQPIAIGIVAYATYIFGKKFLKSQISYLLAIGALIATIFLRTAFAFPVLILLGGVISSIFEAQPEESKIRINLFSNVNPKKVAYFIGILVFFAVLGAIVNRTSPFSLPIRLFENFYRNGVLIFGGGQVLVPLMFNEFVEVKHYLSNSEFLSGYALQMAIPGPTFSFTSFLGGLTMANKGAGLWGQISGSIIGVIGINLPGLILILFIVPFWDDLKKITLIKNSLNGINAVAVGFMLTALLLLIKPFELNWLAFLIMGATFAILNYTKIKTPIIIILGVIIGYVI